MNPNSPDPNDESTALRREIAALRLQLREQSRIRYEVESKRSRLTKSGTKVQKHLKKAQERLSAGIEGLYSSRRWKCANLFQRKPLPQLDRAVSSIESALKAAGTPEVSDFPRCDVVVCVHNALEDVRACLESVIKKTPKLACLVVVNDGSDAATTEYLEAFTATTPCFVRLIHNQEATGYTRAANQGLHAAKGDFIVLLNSDTIVPHGWLERLVRCSKTDSKIGIIGPLSNAASWQSVPELYDSAGDWMVNDLPTEMTVDAVQHRLAMAVPHPGYPRVPLVNGFCFAVTRSVLDEIGYLDEESFPKGYGEENDLCLRAVAAGFSLAIADDTYVFHAKSKSYSHERRKKLSAASAETLGKKHGPDAIAKACEVLAADASLKNARAAFAEVSAKPPVLSALYLLGRANGGGGAHSVVQEAHALRALGCYAAVAIEAAGLDQAYAAYPDLPRDLFLPYHHAGDLTGLASGFGLVVATHFGSVCQLADVVAAYDSPVAAYYVQDYEPFFFGDDPITATKAKSSYTRVPGMQCFAKTAWICETLASETGVQAALIEPGLDHSVYHPQGRKESEKIRVTAMVRPDSPRRGPKRTCEALEMLGDDVEISVFGCADDDPFWETAPLKIKHTKHGVLTRDAVADLLRASDVFFDLSDYQAFGRTGLEAMACGCVPVLPSEGGVSTYATDGENARVVDTRDQASIESACRDLVGDGSLRKKLQAAGLETAAKFSVEKAARSQMDLFLKAGA